MIRVKSTFARIFAMSACDSCMVTHDGEGASSTQPTPMVSTEEEDIDTQATLPLNCQDLEEHVPASGLPDEVHVAREDIDRLYAKTQMLLRQIEDAYEARRPVLPSAVVGLQRLSEAAKRVLDIYNATIGRDAWSTDHEFKLAIQRGVIQAVSDVIANPNTEREAFECQKCSELIRHIAQCKSHPASDRAMLGAAVENIEVLPGDEGIKSLLRQFDFGYAGARSMSIYAAMCIDRIIKLYPKEAAAIGTPQAHEAFARR